MRLFILMFFLFGSAESFAAIEWVRLKENTAVYKTGQEDSTLLVMANAGEKVAVRARKDGFARIQIKRKGKWWVGYIRLSELDSRLEQEDGWGFGGGLGFGRLKQAGKAFETEDQVNYTLSAISGSVMTPAMIAQSSRENFWRLIVGYRLIDFTSKASKDVSPLSGDEVKLKYAMISGTLQKMWNFNRSLYYGLGLEASKALSAGLKIGGDKLAVDSSTLPAYIGGHLAIGYQTWVTPSLSLFVEARGLGFLNQSPMIFGGEGVLGVIYWP